MRRKKRKELIIIGVFLVFLVIAGFAFSNYTHMGYMMTVKLHGFTKHKNNVYVDDKFTGDVDELLEMLNKANERVFDFWGSSESKPTIIISSDKDKLSHLGNNGTPSTTLYVFHGALNYIVIPPSGFNTDVLAHELTHAELYTRVYRDKWYNSTLIPVWFNEGVAMQNDYREKYNEDVWNKVTDKGKNVKDFDSIDSSSEFYNSDSVENYTISRHEISEWISQNSVGALINMIHKINNGERFDDLYFN